LGKKLSYARRLPFSAATYMKTASELTDRQKAQLLIVPEKSRLLIERAYRGTASGRKLLQAKCLECCNFDRKEASKCTSELCPIWPIRPYK